MLIAASLSYLVLLALVSLFGRDWFAFKLLYGAWSACYLVLMYLLATTSIVKDLDRMEPLKAMLLVALVSILLQLPFLLGPASMSQDIMRMERRGELFLEGSFPYRDFTVNKPPLYIWMVGLLSLPFGPDIRLYRTFFVLANSLVPVLMFAIHRAQRSSAKSDEKGPWGISVPLLTWGGAAVGYALCPITILETALAGHYDPVVVLMTLAAYLSLVKDRSLLTGLFLGLGFSLKLYPMFIAPLFFLSFGSWKDRMLLTLGFFTAPVASALPLLVVDPGLVLVYLKYQFVDWYTGYSLRYALEWLLSALGLPLKAAYYTFTTALGLGTLYYILRGMFGRSVGWDAAPLVLGVFVLASMGTGLSSLFLSAGADGILEWAMGAVGILMSILLLVAGLTIYVQGNERVRPFFRGIGPKGLLSGTIDRGALPFVVSCVLLLVVLTSAQFHPWYLSWILPFALASGIPSWIWTVLMSFSVLQSNSYPPWEL